MSDDAAVIAGATPRNGDAPQPQAFDFRYPSTLSRDDARTIQVIQESLANGVATTLASTVRSSVKVRVGAVEQLPYDDVRERLGNPATLVILGIEPIASVALMHLESAFSMALVELLLGGPGTGPHPERAHSEIEQGLIGSWVDRVLPSIGDALEPLAHVEPVLIGQETNPTFVQVASPTDMVLTIGLVVELDEIETAMKIVVPVAALRPYLDAVTTRPEDGAESDEKVIIRGLVQDHITSVDVQAVARFAPARASSAELDELAVGDVLVLDHSVDEPLLLEVGGVPIHEVTIGRIKRDLAVQVAGAAPERVPRGHRLTLVPADGSRARRV